MAPAVTIDDIKAARDAIAGVIPVTPAIPSSSLSERLGCRLTLKLENCIIPVRSRSGERSIS